MRGGGIVITEPEALDRIRKRITGAPAKRMDLVESVGMRKVFLDGLTAPDALKRAPLGYDPDHPALAYLG